MPTSTKSSWSLNGWNLLAAGAANVCMCYQLVSSYYTGWSIKKYATQIRNFISDSSESIDFQSSFAGTPNRKFVIQWKLKIQYNTRVKRSATLPCNIYIYIKEPTLIFHKVV